MKAEALRVDRSPGGLLAKTVRDSIDQAGQCRYPEAPPPDPGRWERLRIGFYNRDQWQSINRAARRAGKPTRDFLADAAHYLFPADERTPLPHPAKDFLADVKHSLFPAGDPRSSGNMLCFTDHAPPAQPLPILLTGATAATVRSIARQLDADESTVVEHLIAAVDCRVWQGWLNQV